MAKDICRQFTVSFTAPVTASVTAPFTASFTAPFTAPFTASFIASLIDSFLPSILPSFLPSFTGSDQPVYFQPIKIPNPTCWQQQMGLSVFRKYQDEEPNHHPNYDYKHD